jgi:hypothetical protein
MRQPHFRLTITCAFAWLLLSANVALASAPFKRAAEPIANSYIVVLKSNVPRAQVQGVAIGLAKVHNGRVSGVMNNAIRAFGFRGSEQAARALTHNPNVAWVEEDAFVHPASDFGEGPISSSPESTPTCGWQGSYYACYYAPVSQGQITRCTPDTTTWNCDDDHWNIDRIDNQGPVVATNRAYGWTSDGNGVRAYVVDFGVRGGHDEFGNRVESGANMMVDPDLGDNTNVTNCDPEDPDGPPCEEVVSLDYSPADNPCYGSGSGYNWGHGTAVASVLGGATVGVARGVTIVPVKVGNCSGQISTLAVARGLDWVHSDMSQLEGRAVVNMSLRFTIGTLNYIDTHYCETDSDVDGDGEVDWDIDDYTNCVSAVEYVVTQLIDADIPVVVSAGNDAHDVSYDAVSRLGYLGSYGPTGLKTITVGGTMYEVDQQGNYSDTYWACNANRDANPGYSSCDRNEGSNHGAAVSIWAPAWYIKVAHASGDNVYRPPGILSSGTSFAAPAVAGAVARILEEHPLYTVDDVWDKLKLDAENHDSLNEDFDPFGTTNTRLLYISVYE